MPCLRNQIEQLRAENEELRQWQEDARSTDPPRQEIAKELGIPWGASIHDKILPAIRSLKREIERLRADAVRWKMCKQFARYENQQWVIPDWCKAVTFEGNIDTKIVDEVAEAAGGNQ